MEVGCCVSVCPTAALYCTLLLPSQAVESLEGQVRSLSDQLHEARALSQKELAEARVHWEEDRLDLLKYQETAVSVCV